MDGPLEHLCWCGEIAVTEWLEYGRTVGWTCSKHYPEPPWTT